ncbi:MAG: nucleotidyltransferase substrate binding protein [Solidesulfovibrio sp. DCME]|uniref:nucleotidyltransferase substrate binding protein n=1 Tax=Solidesulfovibrio sp. DCME TaxID=3447380 RepID=UPI003D11C115
MPEDLRWKQRFDNYRKALKALTDAVELAHSQPLSTLEGQGVIQAFEFTHELAWNVLKDYLEFQGIHGIVGSRGAVREAFKNGLLADGETWMTMIQDRNRSPHTYDEETAREIVARILTEHHPAFLRLADTFLPLRERPGNA